MKRPFFILSVVLIICLLASCRKRYTCGISVFYGRPTGVAFKGYDSMALSEFELTKYAGESNMTQPLSRDTLRFSDILFHTDTATVDSNYSYAFFILEDGIDYQIHLYKAGFIHTITGTRSGPPTSSWEQDEPCSGNKGQVYVTTLQNIHVDSQLVSPMMGDRFGTSWSNYFVVVCKK